ncbi:MAG TPA: Re/Si-specific NAD(P)(+) transhydrogenase subunit alpha [Polyangia bacterium]|nr:Re/Si-specific NAD(P)(+) transhydrogenase subunit alpha [Polyangia bacterium]
MAEPTAPAPKPPLRVGIPKEILPLERRVAATPSTVARIRKLGFDVLVEAGAGEAASYLDSAYAEVGAQIVDGAALYAAADIVCKVRVPEPAEVDRLKSGATLISFIWPAQHRELLERLQARKATVLAMDAVPRVTRAQRMDALSAMANLAGYRAVIEAAHHFGRPLGAQTTAAGRIKPARVLVVGAGVAGLAAIAAARALGAIVSAFDTRPTVREQVQSLGATFLPFEWKGETGEGAGGYARQMSDAYLEAEQTFIAQHAKQSDLIITTALVPGVAAPKLVTSGAVVSMARGSVVVDLAAEQGGNCALTEPNRAVEKFGVCIVGYTDLTSRMAQQASELYAATVTNLLELVVKDAAVAIDYEDEVQRGALVEHDGKITWPPPKPSIRGGAPAPTAAPPPMIEAPPPSPWPLRIALGLALPLLVILALFGSPSLLEHLTVFLLACVVGWHVIWNVTPALHTPLMSVTNAVSGIILIGGLLLGRGRALTPTSAIGAVAVLLASINVAGGFRVTARMLKMFRRS